jgi:hypothetical protein
MWKMFPVVYQKYLGMLGNAARPGHVPICHRSYFAAAKCFAATSEL